MMIQNIRKNVIKTIISFILAFIILYFLITSGDIGKILEILSKTNFIPLLSALIAVYITIILKSLRWRIFLSNIGVKISILYAFKIYFFGQFVNTLLPARIGDFYKAYILKKNLKTARSKSLGTIFIDRFYDFVIMAFLIIISAFFVFRGGIPDGVRYTAFFLFFLIMIAIMLIVFIRKYRQFVTKMLPKKIGKIVANFESGALASLKCKTIPITLLITIIVWSLECVIFYLIISALGLKLPVFLTLFIISMANAIMIVPITPSGLGFVEGGILGILIFLGIDKNLAISVVLINSVINYWNLLFVGFLAYVLSKKI